MSIQTVREAFAAALPEGVQVVNGWMSYASDGPGYVLRFDIVKDGARLLVEERFSPSVVPEDAARQVAASLSEGSP